MHHAPLPGRRNPLQRRTPPDHQDPTTNTQRVTPDEQHPTNNTQKQRHSGGGLVSFGVALTSLRSKSATPAKWMKTLRPHEKNVCTGRAIRDMGALCRAAPLRMALRIIPPPASISGFGTILVTFIQSLSVVCSLSAGGRCSSEHCGRGGDVSGHNSRLDDGYDREVLQRKARPRDTAQTSYSARDDDDVGIVVIEFDIVLATPALLITDHVDGVI
ncbi:hypothetical protein Q7P35_001345 [Cladosporium inversicolor]